MESNVELMRRTESGCTDTGTQGLKFLTVDSVIFSVKLNNLGFPDALPALSVRRKPALMRVLKTPTQCEE